jgi:uncharacterized damage-inducible protein DinB
MTIVQLFLDQLDAEAPRTRRTLERVPEGLDDWKPHDKSMPFGRLAMLVARMPSWFSLIIGQNELNLGGSNVDQTPLRTSGELVRAHDEGMAAARQAISGVTEEYLTTTKWRLLVGERVVSEELRHVVVRDTFAHLAHHRAQLGLYLRLNDIPVPAVYGPSADDSRFA